VIVVATTTSSLFVALFTLIACSFRTRAALQGEILALHRQLAVFQKNAPRLRFRGCDRLLSAGGVLTATGETPEIGDYVQNQ